MKRILTLALLLAPTAALAHPGHGTGFDGGLLHPLTGADHLLAMVGVGLWAGLQNNARWAMPATFLAAMLAGFALGPMVPAVEPTILASLILIGAAIAIARTAPLTVTLPMIALFGAAHGAAHGTEGTGAPFALGMLAATAALLAIGATLGLTLNRTTLRVTGALTLLTGLGLTIAG